MIVLARLEGSHLAGNLLGDPSERDLFVYVPPGYEESDRRYPAAYLLHAYGTTAEQLATPATDNHQRSRGRVHPFAGCDAEVAATGCSAFTATIGSRCSYRRGGGRRRIIRAAVDIVGLGVRCEKCDVTWVSEVDLVRT